MFYGTTTDTKKIGCKSIESLQTSFLLVIYAFFVVINFNKHSKISRKFIETKLWAIFNL